MARAGRATAELGQRPDAGDHRVVVDDQGAVGAAAHVELHPVGPEPAGLGEGLEGVLDAPGRCSRGGRRPGSPTGRRRRVAGRSPGRRREPRRGAAVVGCLHTEQGSRIMPTSIPFSVTATPRDASCEKVHNLDGWRTGDGADVEPDGRLGRRRLATDGGLPQHRARPLLPRRHDRARPSTRSRRPSGSAGPARPRSPASTSPSPPTRSPGSGAAPPRRSAASCARPGWPPAAGPADPVVPTRRPAGDRPGPDRSPLARVPAHPPTPPSAAPRSAPPCPPRPRGHGDRPPELTDHQVAHDRESEAGRPLDVEALGEPAARRRGPRPTARPSTQTKVTETWPHRRPDARPASPSAAVGQRRRAPKACSTAFWRSSARVTASGRGHVGRDVAQVARRR